METVLTSQGAKQNNIAADLLKIICFRTKNAVVPYKMKDYLVKFVCSTKRQTKWFISTLLNSAKEKQASHARSL